MVSLFSLCCRCFIVEQLFKQRSSSNQGGRALLKKLLNDEASAAKREEAYHKIADANLFSEEDLNLLSESLEVSQKGIVAYQFQQAIRYVVTGELKNHDVPPLLTDNGTRFEDRIAYLKGADQIEIICVNSSVHALFTALLPLFSIKSGKISFKHYIHADAYANTAANFVAVVYPLLFV